MGGIPIAAARPKTTLDMVADLQRKLNRKMLKRSKGEGAGEGGKARGGDLKLAQWVALQARTRKMSEEDFTALYKERQAGVPALLDEVMAFKGEEAEEGVMASLCSRVSEASGWFPGGYKEIKAQHSEVWGKVERKVEGMLLLGAMTGDMVELTRGAATGRLEGADLHLSTATLALCKAREALEGYKRRWGNTE